MKDQQGMRYSHLAPEVMEVGLEVAGVGLGTVDYVADTVTLDDIAAAVFDLPPARPIPRPEFHARIHPDDWPGVATHVEALLDPGRDDTIDLTHRVLRPAGDIVWVRTRKKVRFADRMPGARPLTGVFAVIDVTAEHRADLRAEFLIGELAHRSKNLIAVVAGIARQLQRHSTPEEFPVKLQERLAALARNQDAMARSGGEATELSAIVEQQIAPFAEAEGRVTVDGPPTRVGDAAAQTLAMVVHELLTNAVKHGALSVDGGEVRVTWTRVPDGAGRAEALALDWTERGGPPAEEPSRTGFGTQVLTRLVQGALDARTEFDYGAGGLTARFVIPGERLVAWGR